MKYFILSLIFISSAASAIEPKFFYNQRVFIRFKEQNAFYKYDCSPDTFIERLGHGLQLGFYLVRLDCTYDKKELWVREKDIRTWAQRYDVPNKDQ